MAKDIYLCRRLSSLIPIDDEGRDILAGIGQGEIVRAKVSRPRNRAFFRKWWALVKVAYDYWSESCEPLEYKGRAVLPNFDRFRKDLTIMAGFYRPTWNLKGEMRVEPESLSWSSMTEERFSELYDATIRVLLREVFNGQRVKKFTEDELRSLVEEIESFS